MNFDELFRHEEHPLTFKAGETIIERGSTSKIFYVILGGSVEIRYKDHLLATEPKGGVFGELSLVDNEPASADVVATSDTTLAAISEARFQFLIQQHPFFALSVMRVMAERLRNMNRIG